MPMLNSESHSPLEGSNDKAVSSTLFNLKPKLDLLQCTCVNVNHC